MCREFIRKSPSHKETSSPEEMCKKLDERFDEMKEASTLAAKTRLYKELVRDALANVHEPLLQELFGLQCYIGTYRTAHSQVQKHIVYAIGKEYAVVTKTGKSVSASIVDGKIFDVIGKVEAMCPLDFVELQAAWSVIKQLFNDYFKLGCRLIYSDADVDKTDRYLIEDEIHHLTNMLLWLYGQKPRTFETKIGLSMTADKFQARVATRQALLQDISHFVMADPQFRCSAPKVAGLTMVLPSDERSKNWAPDQLSVAILSSLGSVASIGQGVHRFRSFSKSYQLGLSSGDQDRDHDDS